jgi:hypothetical protein
MPAQITLLRTDGTFEEFKPLDDDKSRGNDLKAALDLAVAGDAVIIGPGNYKLVNITRNGVRLHFLPGARVYHDEGNIGSIVQVSSGTHWISGQGIIEHSGSPSPSRQARAIALTGSGNLICEADQIISTAPANAAVYVEGMDATLFRDARQVIARVYDGLEIHECTCPCSVCCFRRRFGRQCYRMLSVDTRGLNRLDDTPDYTMIGGPIGHDDVGLISLIVESPVQGGTFQAPFTGVDLMQYLSWSALYFGGNYATAGTSLSFGGNQFLWPGVYPYVQLPMGLTAADFGVVELVVLFDVFSPGAEVRADANGVQIVPEPVALTAPFVALALAWFRGTRRAGAHRPCDR